MNETMMSPQFHPEGEISPIRKVELLKEELERILPQVEQALASFIENKRFPEKSEKINELLEQIPGFVARAGQRTVEAVFKHHRRNPERAQKALSDELFLFHSVLGLLNWLKDREKSDFQIVDSDESNHPLYATTVFQDTKGQVFSVTTLPYALRILSGNTINLGFEANEKPRLGFECHPNHKSHLPQVAVDISSPEISEIMHGYPNSHHYQEVENQALRHVFKRLIFAIDSEIQDDIPYNYSEFADLLQVYKEQEEGISWEEIGQEFKDYQEQAKKFNWYKYAERSEESSDWWNEKPQQKYPWSKNYSIGSVAIPDELKRNLPNNVLVVGGAARSILRQVLNLENSGSRDFDIVQLGRETKKIPISERYDLRDSDSLEGYFNSRDFTLNEIAIRGDTLLVSDICLADTLAEIVRPTQFTMNHRFNQKGQPVFPFRIMLRALRFATTQNGLLANISQDDWTKFELPTVENNQVKVSIEDNEDSKILASETSSEFRHEVFNLALQLDRASEIGLAEEFHQRLTKLGVTTTANARELQKHLEKLLDKLGSDFVFHFPIATYQNSDPVCEKYEQMAENFYKPKIRHQKIKSD